MQKNYLLRAHTHLERVSGYRIVFLKPSGTADPLDRARESIFMANARRRSLPRSRHSEVE